jgi:hypothetical protein
MSFSFHLTWTIVIKPGPTWQVDLQTGRPSGWIDPGKVKDQQ